MLVRPASIYRNLCIYLLGFFAIYTVYSIVAYDDGKHVPVHRNQRHLYLTVSKDSQYYCAIFVEKKEKRIGDRFENLAPKRILYWTKVFNEPVRHDALSDCPGLSDKCVIDNDRGRLDAADAVVFHAVDIAASRPLPNNRKPSQVFVFQTMETPSNSGRVVLPKNYFNWTQTFLFSSDVIHKYGGFWITVSAAESRGFKVQSFYVSPTRLEKPNKGIFGLVSNCFTASKREKAFDELAKYIDVTIGGKCAKSVELKTICPMGSDCLDLFEKYPFYFAVENTVCTDYVSEKYYNRIMVPSIPIVMRRGVYEKRFPPNSFIAMDDFKNPKEMADHLNYLQSNVTAYSEYFKWRSSWTVAPWNAPHYRNGLCRLCELLNKKGTNDSIPAKSYQDVWKWYDAEARCERDQFVSSWITQH